MKIVSANGVRHQLTKPPIVKIFICGEGGVGKTTMIERLIHGTFNANTIMTIGVQHSLYHTKTPKGKDITLQIWDLGGEERFKVIIPLYVRGAQGGLVVFDESRYPTFRNLPDWIKLVQQELDKNAPLLLVSTKADLVDNQLLDEETISEFCKEHGLSGYLRTSSKTGLNVSNLFNELVQKLCSKKVLF